MRRWFWICGTLGFGLASTSLAHAQTNSASSYGWLGRSSEQLALELPDADAEVAISSAANAIQLGDLRATDASITSAPVRFELAASFGYGFGFDHINLWALGFGLRAGVDLGAIYLGARFDYHFTDAFIASDSPFRAHLWDLGFVVGYDAKLGAVFTLRPNLGLGIATLSIADDSSQTSATHTFFDLAAGVTGLFALGDSVFIGLELRLSHLFGWPDPTGLSLMLTGGVRI
jgi:hypothetical protein